MEYILLLVIIVSLVIGAKKAFGNLDDFMNHYIGDYVICLMEYGELPSLGIVDSNLKKHLAGTGKTCDKNFADFSFESGKPPVGSGSGGTGSGSGSGSGGKSNSANGSNTNSSSTAGKDGKDNSSSDADSDSSGSGGKYKNSGRSTSASPYTNGSIKRSGSSNTADASEIGGQKVRVLADDEEASGRKRGSGGYSRIRSSSYRNDKYRPITGTMLAEIEKTLPKRARAPATSITISTSDEGSRFAPYKKTFIPPQPVILEAKVDDNSGFGFGYIIRWLIIAGMILAIVIFFGSQVMNYSNSKD